MDVAKINEIHLGFSTTSETEKKVMYFICPTCNQIYSATVSTTIEYSKEIHTLFEGVVPFYKYICPECRDIAFEVDGEIVDIVQTCRKYGIRTFSSCAGHAEVRKVDGGIETVWSFENNSDDIVEHAYPGCMIAFYLLDDNLGKAMDIAERPKSIRIERNANRVFVYSLELNDEDYFNSPKERKNDILEGLRNNLRIFINNLTAEYAKYGKENTNAFCNT